MSQANGMKRLPPTISNKKRVTFAYECINGVFTSVTHNHPLKPLTVRLERHRGYPQKRLTVRLERHRGCTLRLPATIDHKNASTCPKLTTSRPRFEGIDDEKNFSHPKTFRNAHHRTGLSAATT